MTRYLWPWRRFVLDTRLPRSQVCSALESGLKGVRIFGDGRAEDFVARTDGFRFSAYWARGSKGGTQIVVTGKSATLSSGTRVHITMRAPIMLIVMLWVWNVVLPGLVVGANWVPRPAPLDPRAYYACLIGPLTWFFICLPLHPRMEQLEQAIGRALFRGD
jgi:hypothetical protein